MRIASKAVLLAGLLILGMGSTSRAHATASSGGITVAPAAIRLELKKGQQTTATNIVITNNYSSAVTLRFILESPIRSESGTSAALKHLSLDKNDATVNPGEKIQQTVTLTDDVSIEPGSQSVDLVVMQQGATGTGVGILPGVRLPVTVIKQDGAVTSLGLAGITGPRLAMNMPHTVTVTLRNTGNMLAIPHGIVTVQTPNGTVVGKGTLNEASQAIAPGATLHLSTTITPLATATVPGMYRVVAEYGLGGDTSAKTGTSDFFYVAWWHITTLVAAVGAGWRLCRNTNRFSIKRESNAHPEPAKRQLLIGRDIT